MTRPADPISLNHIYNFLAPSSPLRSVALLALIQLLAASDELEHLPLTSTILSAALAQWSMSEADKIAFLLTAANVYISTDNADSTNVRAPELATALEFVLLALQRQVSEKEATLALALALAQPTVFDLEDVLKVQGVQDALTGKAAELLALFSADEIEAVPKGVSWVAGNDDFVKSLGIARLDGKAVLRKIRLVAFATLAARSATKTIPYAEVATALQIDVDDVEAWAIDAIRAKLLDAHLSQLQSVVNVTSVSSRGTRRFGPDEWKLLERRLTEWKAAVTGARLVVDDAEALAAAGPITSQRRPQQQRRQQEEVTA
jgi:translation initiation factor 3 subunit M